MKNIIKCLKTKSLAERINNFKNGYSLINSSLLNKTHANFVIDNEIISLLPEDIIYPDKIQVKSEKEIVVNYQCPKQLIHVIAHIEYNAKTIYSDTLIRFYNKILDKEKLLEFLHDISNIANEECQHFELLNNRLSELGSFYGEFDVPNRLWANARATRNDLIGRIAIISLVQEGRGLDSGDRLVNRLKSLGDEKSAGIVKKIIEDEINHVRVGVKWFKLLCEESKIENQREMFKSICNKYCVSVKPPFNKKLRDEANFSEDWYK